MHRLWSTVAKAQELLVAPAFGAPGYRTRSRLWADPDLRLDLRGRTYLVTGANAGIGRAITGALLARSARVIMVCRNTERGRQAQAELAERHDAAQRVELLLADLADLDAVERLASAASRLLPDGLDGLVHNAGALLHERSLSPQGVELTFAAHVLGPFLLTQRLRPELATAAALRSQRPRVVWVSSGGMYTQRLSVAQLEAGPEPYDGLVAYAQAKRAQVELAHRWQQELAADGVTVASMHPGWVDTGGVRRSLPRFRALTRSFLRDAQQGADTAVWLAASPDADDAAGRFFFDRIPRDEHIPLRGTRTPPAEVEQLWSLCRRLTGIDDGTPLRETWTHSPWTRTQVSRAASGG